MTVARPATAPVTRPTEVGLPMFSHSIAIQVSAAVEAANWVAMIAVSGAGVGGEGAAAVEAEPADPEHAGAGHGHARVVRQRSDCAESRGADR